MGSTISSLFNYLFSKKPLRIMMVGLDGAGKTTILYRLKIGEVVTTIPTIGFNVETVEYKNVSFTVWDIPGGRDRMKPLWRHFYPNTDGVIFVVDSNDRDRIAEARYELHEILLEEDLRDSLLLVFANKQDLPNSMTAVEVTNELRLSELKSRRWHITATCVTEEIGLYEGLDWLSNELTNKI